MIIKINVSAFKYTKMQYKTLMMNNQRLFSFSPGDSLSYHNHMPFTTTDRDNDLAKKNCAQLYSQEWLVVQTVVSIVTSTVYLAPKMTSLPLALHGSSSVASEARLKLAEMKVRPVP